MKYKCTCYFQSGTIATDGIWKRKGDELTKLTEHRNGLFNRHEIGEKIIIGADNPIIEQDGDICFAVYCKRFGIKYVFDKYVQNVLR